MHEIKAINVVSAIKAAFFCGVVWTLLMAVPTCTCQGAGHLGMLALVPLLSGLAGGLYAFVYNVGAKRFGACLQVEIVAIPERPSPPTPPARQTNDAP